MDAEQTGNCSVHKSACGKIGTSIAELADLPREPFLRPHPQTDSGLTLALWAYASLGRQSPAPTQESSMTTRGRLQLSRSIFILLMEKPHDRKTQRE
jgi:hypothetical protein